MRDVRFRRVRPIVILYTPSLASASISARIIRLTPPAIGGHVMKILTISSLAIMVGLVLVGSATAEEQKLKFRVVMTEVGGSTMDVAGLKGHSMGAAKYAGFAVFEDGRLAYKTVVSITDSVGETGSYNGYSTYMFQNGDV